MRHQAWVPHHKRHQLGRITADIEELETRMLNRFAKGEMCGETNAMTVGFEDFAQRKEGLNVAAGADDLDDDVEF